MSGKKVVRSRAPEVSSREPRRWLWAAPLVLIGVAYLLLRESPQAPEARSAPPDAAAASRPAESIRRAEPAIRRAAAREPTSQADTTALPTRPAAATAQVPVVTTPTVAPRTAQLNLQVMQEAQKHGWVYTDEAETPCPPQRVRIVWNVPTDLSSYDRGAYFEPLGPAPSETSTSVNGLLLCEGHNFLYRGFEAFYDADRGQWRVYPFPVIEAAPGEE